MAGTIELTKHTFSQAPVRATPRGRFFLGISCVLLAFVTIGFGPTFYFRPFRNVPSVPAYVLVHGAVLSAWYVWLVMQTTLVAVNRIDVHRRLGVAGALLGGAVVVSSLMANLGAVPRLSALGSQVAFDLARQTVIFWSNVGHLLAFSIFLSAAVAVRRRPEVHKRLMVLASISILGPALARIARWPVLGGETGPFAPLVILSLLLAVVAHDAIFHRRFLRVALMGVALRIGLFVAGNAVAGSGAGQSFVRSLI